uniref:Immunoglobulin V-set domain-containing protein n=1 Tax=Sparus aurata TaxID=8175 RepID=A0A671XM96_SPAAU
YGTTYVLIAGYGRVYSKRNERAKINCSHSIDSYNRILWYKQTNGEFEFLGYMLATEAPFSKSKFTMSRPAVLTSSLRIHPVQAADSAVYYCASSRAQWLRKPQQLNKNLKKKPEGEDKEEEEEEEEEEG